MAILLTKNTAVLIQGITGKEGQKAAVAMKEYGTTVRAGVTPGKGGESVADCPVFNSVAEAISQAPDINVSAIYVPPFAAKTAILEAIENDIPLINIITERIPLRDIAYCLAAAREKQIRLLGPSSLGLISPGIGRIGVVGGPRELVKQIFQPGPVGIISRSGGMTNEVAWQIRRAGLGQSTAIHVGGDLLMGTTYADLLQLFEHDDQTKAVVIFGEHGGSYEWDIIKLLNERLFTKPLAIYIGGKFAKMLPEGMSIGHAGAIVEHGRGAVEKSLALAKSGVHIAEHYEDLPKLIKPYL